MKTTNTLPTVLATLALAIGAQACCSGVDADEIDRVLRVSVAAETSGVVRRIEATKLCGADVIAIDDEGTETALEEVRADSGGCEYVAEVDPYRLYTIEATHPDVGGGKAENAESNPACSVPTPPEDIDNSFDLSSGAKLAQPQ